MIKIFIQIIKYILKTKNFESIENLEGKITRR